MIGRSVVIAGAGVTGASAAYHLAARGWRVRLSLLARHLLRRFEAEIGIDPGYRPAGYLFPATRAEEIEALGRARAVQRAAGLTDGRALSLDASALPPERFAEGVGGGEAGLLCSGAPPSPGGGRRPALRARAGARPAGDRCGDARFVAVDSRDPEGGKR